MDTFKVDDAAKFQLVQQVMPQLFDALASVSSDGDVCADDVIDFLSLCTATLLDNDTHLTTPRHLRLGAQTVAKHVERRTKELRAAQEGTGQSLLSLVLALRGNVPGGTSMAH
ncbi:hypothetical protein [Sphingomonas immobilis]|uniref:Uncharacterized protein n=1 Tax=Sphingomonas immobilis TaxID=3063997 RepID=A0ABT8ZVX3_9SPHN|nr:hypothetical protein [Sphingomonas sp. CA1-15]MDO7841723.1 hypothetical protein [Sphingomonas sp. CA1-15]